MSGYFFDVLDGESFLVEAVVDHYEVEAKPVEQLEDVVSQLKGEGRHVKAESVELCLREAHHVVLGVELLSMVKFLGLGLSHPVVDGADFRVALDDGDPYPVFLGRGGFGDLGEAGVHGDWTRPL